MIIDKEWETETDKLWLEFKNNYKFIKDNEKTTERYNIERNK